MHQGPLLWLLAATQLIALPVNASGAPGALGGGQRTSRELAELYRVDQEDQDHWEQLGDDLAGKRQAQRRERVFTIVTSGQLYEALDYHNASWLLQHGEGVDDFLMAHILASTAAFEGLEQADFMSAAALDRFMGFVGQPQRFGSQSFDRQGTDLGATELLSDVVVNVFQGRGTGLHGRTVDADARDRRKLKAAGGTLKKLARQIAKTPPDGEELELLLARAEQIVQRGQLDAPADFYNAGVILSHARHKDRLLLAHIMATTSGLLRHKRARELYMRTLDRYMLALGRAPIFSEGPEDGPARPRILELHRQVRNRIAGRGKRRR